MNYFFFYQTSKRLPGSNPLIGFPAHDKAADAFTELIELMFETNKLPIGKDIIGRQDEGHYRHDKIMYDEPTRVALNYFKCLRNSISLAGY